MFSYSAPEGFLSGPRLTVAISFNGVDRIEGLGLWPRQAPEPRTRARHSVLKRRQPIPSQLAALTLMSETSCSRR